MVIDNFLKDIIYFKYREEKFYYKLYNQLISLEDYMAKINDENDNLNAAVIYRQLDDKIKAIYDTIFTDYGSSK